MYNCENIFDKTDEYLDGELSQTESKDFEEHLKNCEECRKNVESAKKLNSIMHGMPSIEPPADFLENLHKRIEREKKVVPFYRKWQPYSALAACVMLAVVIRTNVADELNESSSYLGGVSPSPTEYSSVVQSVEDTAIEIADVQMPEPTEIPVKSTPEARVEIADENTPAVETKAPKQAVQIETVQATSAPQEVIPAAQPVEDMLQPEAEGDNSEPSNVAVYEDDVIQADTAAELQAPMMASENVPSVAAYSSESAAEDTDKMPSGGAVMNKASSSSGGGGGSAANSSWVSGVSSAPASDKSHYTNVVSAEHKNKITEIIENLGIEKGDGIYSAPKAVYNQFVSQLNTAGIPFDGNNTVIGDDVLFVIEWK